MNTVNDIIGELSVIAQGIDREPVRIARHTIWRFLADAAAVGHTGHRSTTVPNPPAEDLANQVPDRLKGHAGSIMLALCRLATELGGPPHLEMGLPLAYAAEAILAARDCRKETPK